MSERSSQRPGVGRRALSWLAISVLVVAGTALLVIDRLGSAPGRWSDGLPVGEQPVAGLAAPVEVLWDSVGVPQVWAQSDEDLLFAQGWLHAHHRLWQMEMFRRVATGRLSELFGEPTVATDRFLRTLGLRQAAVATAEALDAHTRGLVQRYVDGVNARMATLSRRPPEMLVLGVTPEPWTLADVTAIEKILAWDLSAYGTSLDHADALRELGPEQWERVRPEYPRWAPTIEGDTPPASPDADRLAADPLATAPAMPASPNMPALSRELLASARVPADAAEHLDKTSIVRASNSWVVGPSRSASGRPLLANDPHLSLDHPNIWYVMGLHAPEIDVVGTSVAGMPGIVLGHTPGVAWGFTNAYLDDMDLFVERVDPADTTRYLTPEGSAPFEQRIEEIWVRGREVPDTIVVRSTRHGPVMTPVEPRAGEDLLSLQWIAHDTTHAQRALLKLLRVQTAGELLLAMQDMDVAHQNVVFADTAGAWGYWMAGRIPVRPTGTARLLPVPGWTGEGDWLGYLPFSEHPHQLAPERGFIATANNRQSWAPVSWQVSEEVWAEPFRAMRITERLSAGRNLTADSMAALQNDVTSSFAQRYLPAAVRAFQGAGYDSIAASLETWDGAHTLDDTRAPVFHAWVRALQGQLRRAELGSDEAFFPRSLVERRLDAEAVADELAVEAAREARAQVAGMSWGQVHTLTLDHPLAAVPALRTLFGFGRVGVPRQGGPHTVDVAEMSGSAPAWVVRWGASQRHVVDMADPDATGTFVIPGGASGWPGDDLTMSQFDRWLAGERISVPLSRERVEARTIARLQLRP